MFLLKMAITCLQLVLYTYYQLESYTMCCVLNQSDIFFIWFILINIGLHFHSIISSFYYIIRHNEIQQTMYNLLIKDKLNLVMRVKYNIAHIYLNPCCLQTTAASSSPQLSSHTLPHWLLCNISNLPSWLPIPPTNLICGGSMASINIIE